MLDHLGGVPRFTITVRLLAGAGDPDGAVAKVEFFRGDRRLGEDLTPPFKLVVAGLGVGEHTFSARVTDDTGETAVSPPVTLTVAVTFTELVIGPDGSVRLALLGVPGQSYELQASSDLSGWFHVADVTAGPDGSIGHTAPPAPEAAVRFYRVVAREANDPAVAHRSAPLLP